MATPAKTEAAKGPRYIEAVGRRKQASARVRITPNASTTYVVNDRELNEYFPTRELQATVSNAISLSKVPEKYKVSALVSGGGIVSQAEAIRLGIARALVLNDENMRVTIKKLGFLKRDARVKERKKFGLKKARKSPQWSKR
jgi:small subunit ribosomal protein S9